MKNVKKPVGCILCLAFVIGCISGCGGFGGKSDESLLMSSIAEIRQADSFERNQKFSGHMSVKTGESTDAFDLDVFDFNMEMASTQFKEPFKAKADVKISLDVSTPATEEDDEVFDGNETIVGESYAQKQDAKYVVYGRADDTDGENNALDEEIDEAWMKKSLENKEDAMAYGGISNSIEEYLPDDVSKYTKKEDREEGDKRYLVYECGITGAGLKSIIKNTIFTLMEISLDAEHEKLLDEVVDNTELVMTVLIDREEQCMARVEVPMTNLLSNLFNAILEYQRKDIEGDVDEKEILELLNQMKMEASDVNMTVTYSKINKAEDFTIPQEALDAKEERDFMDLDDVEDEDEE